MQYLEGILNIANVFLAIVAGFIAISLFKVSQKRSHLKPWKVLIITLVFFALQEILHALKVFDIYSTLYLTHIIPTIILALLIYALILQIGVAKK